MNTKLNNRSVMYLFGAFFAISALVAYHSTICLADALVSTPVASDAVPVDYLITQNDQIDVKVINFPDLNTTGIVVPNDGKVNLPLIGRVSVVGKTTEQLSDQLTTLFGDYVIKPIVNVVITIKHPQTVSVGGSVNRAGTVEYIPNLHLVDAIIRAGGPLTTANMSQVSVVHKDGEKQTFDLSRPDQFSSTPDNIVLRDGDEVYVPESTREISIVGEVKSPGSYPYHIDMTVLDAVNLAGGTTDTADLKHSTLSNGPTSAPLDLQKAMKYGDMTANVVLHPGDTITIPLIARNYVFGDVYKPGYVAYVPGDRVFDALNAAGGTTSEGDNARIRLVRIADDKNSAQATIIDLPKFFKDGDMSANPQIEPGDVLYVPDRRKGFAISDIFSVLSGVNLVNIGANIARNGLGH